MIVYSLSSNAPPRLIRRAYALVDSLRELGIAACIAEPNGRAADWFRSTAPVWHSAEAATHLRPSDVVLGDDERALALAGATAKRQLVCTSLDTQEGMRRRWEASGSHDEALSLGTSIDDVFFYSAEIKRHHRAALSLSTTGSAAETSLDLDAFEVVDLDQFRHEDDRAAALRRSDVFIVEPEGDDFAETTMEAMAAACIVVTVGTADAVPDAGQGSASVCVQAPTLSEAMGQLQTTESARSLAARRHRGAGLAGRFRRLRHQAALRTALESVPSDAFAPWGGSDFTP